MIKARAAGIQGDEPPGQDGRTWMRRARPWAMSWAMSWAMPCAMPWAVLCLALPSLIRAQQAEPAGERLEQVVVTAQKREQNLQDVGTSITTFDANSIARIGMADTTDIARQVPGLQFNQFAPSITVFNLRGVSQNDFSDHQEAPVAVYADEAYVASMGAIAGSIYDIERVEVLRGPQGTLFGRNATGGLIHYISKPPTERPEGYVELTGGRFGEFDTEGAVSGPVTKGLSARLSFATKRHDGYVYNRIGPDGGDQNQYAARLQLLFKLSDEGQFLLKLHGLRNIHEVATAYSWQAAYPNSQGLGVIEPPSVNYWGTCGGCDIYGYRNPAGSVFDQAFGRPGGGIFDRTLYGATGHLTLKWAGVTLTSITDFQHLRKRYGEDTDASPNLIVYYDTWQSYHQFSEELRANGSSGPVEWIGGLYYLDLYSDDRAEDTLPAAFGGSVGDLYNIKTRSWAAFAQGEWQISSHWKAILGGRITEDQKTDDYRFYAGTPANILYHFNTGTNPQLADRRWRLPSGKLELDYKLSRDDLIYLSANRGVKGGGFAQPSGALPGTPEQLVFNPEKLTSYELGIKTTFLDGRARFNAAAFYYHYVDYQAYTQEGLNQAIANLLARIKGGEAELAWVPLKGLELQAGLSGLSSILKNATLPAGQVADRVMPQAPKWSLNALARYQWNAMRATWSVEADLKSDTPQYFSTFNSPADREPGKTVVNARAGFTSPGGNLDLAIFCRNLTDKRYRVYDLDLSSVSVVTPVYAPPRWYGASATLHW